MALRDRLNRAAATATLATLATDSRNVATVATVAVADPANRDGLDEQSETRRQKVLALLDAKPGITRAMVTDDETEPEFVILTVAIRGIGTADIRVPRISYDPFRLLELLARHNAEQVH